MRSLVEKPLPNRSDRPDLSGHSQARERGRAFMAISTVSACAAVAALGSLKIRSTPKPCLVSLSSKARIPKSSISSSTPSNARYFRASAVPDLLDSEDSEELVDVPLPDLSDEQEPVVFEDEDAPEASPIPISADFDANLNDVTLLSHSSLTPGVTLTPSSQMAPKQKIRIKLKSYFAPLIEDSAKQIVDAAKSTNAKAVGPIPLPTKRRIYCVLKSPHVNKDARFHFEIRTHQRLIDIVHPTAQTIDALMLLHLPAGVDVQLPFLEVFNICVVSLCCDT
ncbi:hypothetical protein ACLOJK_035708 [Asimina triloba]